MKKLYLLLIIFLNVSLTFNLSAQNGVLRGIVYDYTTKKEVFGAHIQLINNDSTINKDFTTDITGKYNFENLPDSYYSIIGTKEGYEKVMSSGIRVMSNKITFADIKLPPENKKNRKKKKN